MPVQQNPRTRTLLRLEWWRHRRDFQNLLGVSLFAMIAVPGDTVVGFMIIGTVVSAYAGIRLIGEDSSEGRLEFILSRGMSRSWLFHWRYAFGLILLMSLFTLVLVCDALNSHARLWTWVSEIPMAETQSSGFDYSTAVGFLIMSYSIAFALGCHLVSRRALAIQQVIAIFVSVSLFLFVNKTIESLSGRPFSEPWTLPEEGQSLVSVVCVTLGLLFFLGSRSRFLVRPL